MQYLIDNLMCTYSIYTVTNELETQIMAHIDVDNSSDVF